MGGRGGPARLAERVIEPKASPGAAGDDRRLLEVVRNLAAREGGGRYAYLDLVQVRSRMAGVSRERQDAAIRRLLREGRIGVIPEEKQKTLTPRQRDTAFRYGGENNHILRYDRQG